MLPPYITDYWGKAADGGAAWHPAAYHLLDVAAVADALVTARPEVARQAETILPGLTQVLPLVCALHDLGKFTAGFQAQIPDLMARLWDGADEPLDRPPPHGDMGALIWEDCAAPWSALTPRVGQWGRAVWTALLRPSFGHHGTPPGPPPCGLYGEHVLRDESEADIRALVTDLGALLLPAPPPGTPEDGAARRAGWLVAGVVILADWIGSNRRWFDFRAPDLDLASYWRKVARLQAATAIAEAGLAAPRPRAFGGFAALTGITAAPSPLQRLCLALPLVDGPQVVVIEDRTGSGKTEAALVLAARFLERGQGGRVFVGLPTHATANAMFGRLGKVYRRLFASDAAPSLGLAHGGAWLHEGFREALAAPQPQSPQAPRAEAGEEAPASAQANAWLADNRKKALLSDVGIGTLDQALLGVVKARHQGLRLLGVSGGVLIADEVHAYDTYTRDLLMALLRFQAALGGSAILLSATLSASHRRALLEAFAEGRQVALAPAEPASAPYPLVTHWHDDLGAPAEHTPDDRSEPRRIQVARLDDEAAAVALLRRAAQDGCACWIRNTVADARAAYRLLAEHLPGDRLTLFHAAFTPDDRARLERQVIDAFGKDSGPDDRKGRVLVATQVVEQSLDLDFDAMVSDLAPVDLLLQRAGRLHRHVRRPERPPPVLHVLGPEAIPDPDAEWYARAFPRAAYVYPDAARLWLGQRLLTGPDAPVAGIDPVADARRLIEGVYGVAAADGVPAGLQGSLWEAEGREHAEGFLAGGALLRPDMAFTRDGWEDDMIIRTRLGEERRAVVLAVEERGRLRPLAEVMRADAKPPEDTLFAEHRAWAESEVSVPARRITGGSTLPPTLGEQETALRHRLRWPAERPLLVLLHRDTPAAPWTGEASCDDSPVPTAYDPVTGLSLGDRNPAREDWNNARDTVD